MKMLSVKWDENAIKELDLGIANLMAKGLDFPDEENFNQLAVAVFNMQYQQNEYFRNYCMKLGISPERVKEWTDIPAIPTKAFRENIIASFPLTETELALLTSGTTDLQNRGKIYRDKASLSMILRANYQLTKKYLFPDIDKMRILLLVPSPQAAPGMPMAFGLEQARQEFGTEDSAYFITPEGFQTEEMIEALQQAEAKGEPVCILGATSGYVFFFNQCRTRGLKFNLPEGSRVCDGGGYQGTFGPCSRTEFYAMVQEFLNIPEYRCVNILGMGESGTNYFDNVLYDFWHTGEVKPRYKIVPHWTRTVIVGVRTGQIMPPGEIGLIKHYDLTNRATVLAVLTDNLGYQVDGGFEIVGRANSNQSSLVNGSYNGIKDWVLGVGSDDEERKMFAVGCSIVADGMIQGHPHGMPCSTVADGMMQGHPHGMPCSTVADGMMMGDNRHK